MNDDLSNATLPQVTSESEVGQPMPVVPNDPEGEPVITWKPEVTQPDELELVTDETLTALYEKLTEAEQARDLAQGAMRAQDENYRQQLEALGLAGRFPNLTHLADDMGEALLRAEKRLRLATADATALMAFVIRFSNRLKQTRQAIETAITSKDGLDGSQGEDLLTLIDADLQRLTIALESEVGRSVLVVLAAAERVKKENANTSWNIGAIHELIEAVTAWQKEKYA